MDAPSIIVPRGQDPVPPRRSFSLKLRGGETGDSIRIGAVRPLAAARASRTHRVAFRSLAGRKPGNSGGRLAGIYLAERPRHRPDESGACRCPANRLGHIERRDQPLNVRFAIGRE